jgi:hypothetical protein
MPSHPSHAYATLTYTGEVVAGGYLDSHQRQSHGTQPPSARSARQLVPPRGAQNIRRRPEDRRDLERAGRARAVVLSDDRCRIKAGFP